MFQPRQRVLALSLLLAYPLAQPLLAHAADTGTDTAAEALLPAVQVKATRSKLDAARNGLSPDTGSSVYRFDSQDIARLPQGEDTPLNQVLLQTPGVVQDSYGAIHVRGDHGNVQYRIDGVVIPEAISGFGQSLETRFADHLSLLTGALPAQYGYRTAAVVDIQTKGGETEQPGLHGNVGLTLGTQGQQQTDLSLHGNQGALSYDFSTSYLGSKLGIENPTSSRNALHDQTHQGKSFGSLSYLLDEDSRVSLLFGVSNNRFEIPDVPGQSPSYTLAGSAAKDSATLDARQRERNRFLVLSYQGVLGPQLDYQVSLFHRYTDVHYQPDQVGDLEYDGIAADILRRNEANGVQADLSYRLNHAHTLRAGLFGQHEHAGTDDNALVFPADADGNQSSSTPVSVRDDARLSGGLWGAYVQDEWKLDPALTFNYGLRYDAVSTVTAEHQWSPRLGLVWDLAPTVRLHAGYARYFTPPPTEKIDTTSVSAFAGTTNALPSDANTAVKSERSNYYDAGLAWQASPRLSLSLDGYYRDIRHLQDEGQFGNALIYSAFNYARGRIYGLDLSANYKDGAFAAYLNLGSTHARATQVETGQFNFDDDELAYIASHWVHLDHEQKLSASAGGSYRFDSGYTLGASAVLGSGLRNDFANTGHLPGYASFNADLAKRFKVSDDGSPLEVRLAVLNLFDRIYQLRDGSGIGVGAPQYGQRRSLSVSLNKDF